MPIQNIEHRNISERVFEQLKNMITEGEWKPGDKLPSETELAQAMGVSRVSVRAAIQRLVSVGVLNRQQGKGTVVCELLGSQQMSNLIPVLVLDTPNLQTMNEFRLILECGTAEAAASRCTDEDIAALEQNLAQMKQQHAAGEETFEQDVHFHFLIANASKNALIIQTERIMQDSFLQCMREQKKIMGDDQSIYYHQALIDALKQRNGAHAMAIMHDHLYSNLLAIQNGSEG